MKNSDFNPIGPRRGRIGFERWMALAWAGAWFGIALTMAMWWPK